MPKRTDAFVLWVDRNRAAEVARPADGSLEKVPSPFSGRVEHVRSSRRAHFASTEELLRFFAESMAADEEPEPEPQRPPE